MADNLLWNYLPATLMREYKAGEGVPRCSRFAKLLSGSSFEGYAFFKKPQNSEL